jgi:integrase
VKRDRVLSDAELRAVWLEAKDYGGDFGAIVRLLILIGARREEVGGVLWNEIDLAEGVWTLGADRSKNGQRHELPLSVPVLAILQGVKGAQSKHEVDGAASEYAFGKRGSGFSGWSKAKGALDKRVLARLKKGNPQATMPDWRLHDIRRSVATGMADLGVQPHVIEAVLNHISGHKAGVAGVYNRANYAAEKRAALDLWAGHIQALVNGGEGGADA